MSLADKLVDDAWDHLLALRDKNDVDALAVVAQQAERLAMGNRQYGNLDMVGDRRVWLEETLCEMLDACVYIKAELRRMQAERENRPTERQIAIEVPGE